MNDFGLLNFELHIDILIHGILLEQAQGATHADAPDAEDPPTSVTASPTPVPHYTSYMYTNLSTYDIGGSASSSSEFE